MFSIICRVWNEYYLFPKVIYIVLSISVYSIYSFRPVFFEDVYGVSTGTYGLIQGVLALFNMLISTGWSFLADKTKYYKSMLLIAMVSAAIVFQLLLLPFPKKDPLPGLVTVWSAYNILLTSYWMLIDNMVVKELQKLPGVGKEFYGRQRLWGTISAAATTFTIGYATDNAGYIVVFYFVGISSAILIVLSCLFFPNDKLLSQFSFGAKSRVVKDSEGNLMKSKEEEEQGKEKTVQDAEKGKATKSKTPIEDVDQSKSNVKNKPKPPLFILLTNPKFMFFLLVVFLVGTVRAIMTLFHTRYLEKEMKLSKTQIGLITISGVLLEIVIFFMGKFFLEKFSPFWLVAFSQIGLLLRCGGYALTPTDKEYFWAIFLSELGKGISFGFMQISGVQLCNTIAPVGLEATAQSLFGQVYVSLPTVFSGVFGGKIMSAYGGIFTIKLGAYISMGALFLYLSKGAIEWMTTSDSFHKRRNEFFKRFNDDDRYDDNSKHTNMKELNASIPAASIKSENTDDDSL